MENLPRKIVHWTSILNSMQNKVKINDDKKNQFFDYLFTVAKTIAFF